MAVTALKIDSLEAWLKRGATEVFTITVSMNPVLAQQLLDRNADNRPVRWNGALRCVEAYARAMVQGEWVINGESIIISSDGFLNDGQHRLHAVIVSGVVVPMQLTFGVERETRRTVDQGAARTPGNVLAMLGEKNHNTLAHALQFVWCYDGVKVFGYRPSPDEMLATLAANPGLRDAVTQVGAFARPFRLSLGYVAGAYHVCSRVDANLAALMLSGAETGLNIRDAGSPILRLRKRCQEHLASKNSHMGALEQAAVFIKAFNALLERRNMRNLIWRQNGPTAENFPVAGA
ncbi:hypothetical protein [Paraburkholderia fungorum]|uniref:hypothetical protein n=1 Tax=Paraburkholderia fungorum TaxID=134537 RepID=UPI003D6C038C